MSTPASSVAGDAYARSAKAVEPVGAGLKGKSALICGASRGLGLACAHALAGEGADVTLVARGQDRLLEAERAIRSVVPENEVRSICADLTTQKGQEQVIGECADADILVMTTVRQKESSASAITVDEVRNGLETGLIAPVNIVVSLVNRMCDRRFGRVVTILGSSTKAPVPSHTIANVARAGLAAAMASLAREVASCNVTINNILAGPVETESLYEVWLARAKASDSTMEELQAQAVARIPAQRLGRAEEIASVCLMLCMPHLGYLTGQSIVVDGGAFPGLF